MIRKRLLSWGDIFALDLSENGSKNVQEHVRIQIVFSIRAGGNNEGVGAWAAKSLPSLLQTPELNVPKKCKLISVTDSYFHGILYD